MREIIQLMTFKLLVYTLFCLAATALVEAKGIAPEAVGLQTDQLWFEPNRGQVVDSDQRTRPDVLYTAQIGDVRLFVRKGGLSYVFVKNIPLSIAEAEASLGIEPGELSHENLPKSRSETFRVDVDFEGASADVTERGGIERSSVSNYYLGHCPDGLESVRHYGDVVLGDLYENIDLRLYFDGAKFKYDFIVRPGGDWRDISMRIVGTDKVALLEDGRLRVDNPFGWMIEDAPISWQAGSARDELASRTDADLTPRRSVASRFVLEANRVTFNLGHVDKQKELIIDPGVVFSSYLGGSDTDIIRDVTVDSERRIYVIGDVNSTNLPVTPGVIQRNNAGSTDVMFGRYTVKGSLEWLTYYGASELERGNGIAVSIEGRVGICGATASLDFPTTPGVVQETKGFPATDGFVAVFSSEGVRRWATYMGSDRADAANAIAADYDNHFCVVGETADNSTVFPQQGARFRNKDKSFRGGFVSRLNKSVGTLIFSTYYTSPDDIDQARGVAVDRANNIYVVGDSGGQMPTLGTDILEPDYMGSEDVIISKWSSTGRFLLASHFGTAEFERGYDIAVQEDSGNIVIVGETGSANFPLENPLADQPGTNGNSAGFVAVIDNSLQNVLFSSLISSASTASVRAVDVKQNTGEILLAGHINADGLLVSDDAEQEQLNPDTGDRPDAFLWHIAADGSELLYGSYYGSSGDDRALGATFDQIDNFMIVGQTTSTDLPMVNGQQISSNGSQEGFMRKYGCEISTEIMADGPLEFCQDGDVTLTAGAGFASYRWSNGAEEQSIVVDASGDYSVTVGDGTGCEFTTPATVVTVFPTPQPVITPDGPIELCNGESVTLDAGPGFESYKWSNDAETQTITVDVSGTYFVVVSGEGGCEAETEIEVTVRPTPNLGLQPTELDWGVLDGCQSSVTLPLTITNTNGFQVRLTELEFENSAEFSASGFTANTAIEPGAELTLDIVFTPATTTPLDTEVRILLEPCGAVITVPLRGSKGELLLTASPSNINFGELLLCETSERDSTIYFTNSGNENVVLESALFNPPFSVVDLNRIPLTILPGERDSLRVRFAPPAEGDPASELTIFYTSGTCNDNLQLGLRASARDPEVKLRTGDPLAFPPVINCDEFSDAILLLDLAPDASGTLKITAIEDAAAQISGQEDLPIDLPATELVRLPLRFTPASEGLISGAATITYELNGCSKTISFEYSGEKRGIDIGLPESIDFGTYVACAEQSRIERVPVDVSGEGVTVRRIQLNGDFATNLLEGAAVPESFTITFATDADDDVRGSMFIVFDPCGIEREIELIGRRVDLSMSGPAAEEFGVVDLGDSPTRTITWTNDGTAEIRIESIDCLAEPFSLVSPAQTDFPLIVMAGADLELEVAFNPTAPGAFSGELCVNSSQPCNLVFRTALSGTGDEDIVLPGNVTLSFPELIANPRAAGLEIPILVNDDADIEAGTLVSARAYVRLNSSVFFPRSISPGTIAGAEIENGERRLVLDTGPVTLIAGQPLTVIQGVPLLGDQVTSDLILDSVVILTGNIDVTLANGQLTLDSLCEAGGTRLLTTNATAFGISSLLPNPAGGMVEISLSGIDVHGAEIELLDMSGRRVHLQKISSAQETPVLQLELDGIPAGSYWLVLRSMFRNDIKQLLVIE